VTKYVLALTALAAVTCVVSAAEKTVVQREREVRVALALADAKAESASPKAPATTVKKVKFDWFGDEADTAKSCPCGAACKCEPGKCPANCPAKASDKAASPVKAEPKYRVELRQECTFDVFGRRTGCHWVEYHVPIESGK